MARATQPTLDDLLAQAAAEGARLWPSAGRIHYRTPEALSAELTRLIAANKAALLVRLATWDGPVALHLMFDADEAVATSGVSSRDEVIQRESDRCLAAHAAQDMAGVRAACAQIEDRCRKLAICGKDVAA